MSGKKLLHTFFAVIDYCAFAERRDSQHNCLIFASVAMHTPELAVFGKPMQALRTLLSLDKYKMHQKTVLPIYEADLLWRSRKHSESPSLFALLRMLDKLTH